MTQLQYQFTVKIFLSNAGSDSTPEDYGAVAAYFEKQRKPFLAGKFFYLANQHAKV